MTEDLTRLTAGEMSERVRSHGLDPVALLDAHLDRIAAVEPQLRAFSTVLGERARADAQRLRGRHDLGSLPLAGVPVAIKDNTDVAGEVTTFGSLATPRTPAEEDDLLVRRLRDAGAVVIGRTRLPELAIWPFTEFESEEPCRNPWDRKRTPGGSSGGSAAAVAARMTAIALASDGGGSIRIPAACCGVVGIKPAPGLVPVPGGREHWFGLSAFGPIARTVGDAALALDVLANTHVHRDPGPPGRPLRIAVSMRHPVLGAGPSRGVRQAIEATASSLRGAGHDVVWANPAYPPVPLEFLSRFLAGIAEDAAGLPRDRLEKRTRDMARLGQRLRKRARPAGESRWSAKARRWISDFDLLLAPVLSGPAVPIGKWRGRGWLSTALGASRWMGYAPPWNLAGMATVAIPAGSEEGLPMGVQLVGVPGSEGLLISVAAQLERLQPVSLAPL